MPLSAVSIYAGMRRILKKKIKHRPPPKPEPTRYLVDIGGITYAIHFPEPVNLNPHDSEHIHFVPSIKEE